MVSELATADLVDCSRDAGDVHMALLQLQQATASLKSNVCEDVGVQPAASGQFPGCWDDVNGHPPQVT